MEDRREEKYKWERYDLVSLLKKLNDSQDLQSMAEFKNLLEAYFNYIENVTLHVIFEHDFSEYGGDSGSRSTMEMYNGMRVAAHNAAIQKTLQFQRDMLSKHGVIFCQNCIGKTRVDEFTPTQRRELGDFIFSTVSTCSTLTEPEIEKIGMSMEDMNNILGNIAQRKEKLERGYRVEITNNPDDIYDSLS